MEIKEYNRGIELLRIILMFMVVILHVLGAGGILSNADPMSGQYFAGWALETVCYGAVDTFALVSGYVMWREGIY